MAIDLALSILLGRWAAGWYLGGRIPMLEAAPRTDADSPHSKAPRLSVIVPARNEQGSLPNLLASLANQTVAPFEVLVVDDASSDETAALARAAGVAVVELPEPPSGWLGKPWACWQGAHHSTGDVLVFVDADTVMGPEFLERLAQQVSATPGIVSVAPFHSTQRPYEQASALFNMVSFMGIGVSSLRRSARITGAFGPCIALGRADYERIDGHRSVRAEVLEDIAIAERARSAGVAVRNFAGGEHFRYRMYPNGVSQLIQGWSKNIAGGATSTPWLRLLAIIAWMSGLIEAGWAVVTGLLGMPFGGGAPSFANVVVYCLFALQLLLLLRRVGSFSLVSILHPFATLAFVVVFVRSAVWSLRGEVVWKDRTITLRAPRTPPS